MKLQGGPKKTHHELRSERSKENVGQNVTLCILLAATFFNISAKNYTSMWFKRYWR